MTDSEIFVRRIADHAEAAARKSVDYTGFLSEEEQIECAAVLKKLGARFSFFGGIENAERKVCAVYTEFFSEEWLSFPISLVEITLNDRSAEVRHPDCLGSLLGLGLKRSVIGDIVFHNGKIYVAAEEKIAEHICSQLDRIGKYACSAKVADPSVIVSNERRFETVGLIISSNRLDCYVSAIAGISRERAASEIKAGNIRLNGAQVYEATKRLSLGDRLSVRGSGKYIVDSDPNECTKTHKNRLRINLKKYERSN